MSNNDYQIGFTQGYYTAMTELQEKRKKGHWIKLPPTDAWEYICDQCGRRSDFVENYCPECGAEMKGGDE